MTTSLWMEVQLPSFSKLETNTRADVCIVGAGIAGLTCAYTLAKEGKSVIIVDQGSLAGGQTARTTAHLTWILDERYYELEKIYGLEGARLAADSHSAAIDYMEKIIQDEKIECDFERIDGYLFLASEDSENTLDKELKTLEKMGRTAEKASTPFDQRPALRFPNQAQFHILKYLQGLVKAIFKYGGKIYCNTHIEHFEDGTPCRITTKDGVHITAESIIVATCTPINNRLFIHTKQAAYRTFVIGALAPKGALQKGIYWDTGDPYHYIRTQKHLSDPTHEWIIIGGDDHKTGQDKNNDDGSQYRSLEKWAKKRLPFLEKIEFRWSGQVFNAVDSLAFVGKNPWDKNTYIVTGDTGNGITTGTFAGILIPDLISNRPNPWKDLYKPSRKTLSTAATYIEEVANATAQYVDWLTPGEKKDLEALPKNQGIIIREGLKKLAIYKDEEDTIHACSALCPHLAGCVRWNADEKSWDCPCHGSRFNTSGEVINGPANSNLKKV
jgi:glycine/D-amino acid oxidase-like deaminating enzyme/nitrite reductase/ring-hydroxylating ferredoxin subunit